MKRYLTVISLSLVVVMLASLLSACSAEKKFIGTWEELDSNGERTSNGETLVFANDGNGTIESDGISGSLTWSVEKDKITIIVSVCGMAETYEFTYRFSGNTMTLIDEDGDKTVYRRSDS